VGLEVDFVVPRRGGGLALVDCKANRTVVPAMAHAVERLRAAVAAKRPRTRVRSFIVHAPARSATATRALTAGVEALPWTELCDEL
jgi:hypothetical protein